MHSFVDDPLLPQRAVKKMFGDTSDMTMWRHRQRGILPEPVKINGRNFWRRSVAEQSVAFAIGVTEDDAQ
jgi:predicted DNA-binding transcriptional regulator AlpA